MVVNASILIPPVLLLSNDFSVLSTEQQQEFQSRLRHCSEIVENAFDALNKPDTALLDAIDDMELDAFSVMSIFYNKKKTVSPYIIHSSWTFECDHQAMVAHVGADAIEFLESPGLPFSSTYSDVRNWLRRWARTIQTTLERFSHSSSFTEVIVQLIIIDALVASYLVFSATVRLNGNIF